MPLKYLSLSNEISKEAEQLCGGLGIAMHLMSRSREFDYRSISEAAHLVEIAIKSDRIIFFYGSTGDPVGYVIYAEISEDTEAKIMEKGVCSLHLSELSDGRNFWIIDFVAPFGNLRYILNVLSKKFEGCSEISYYRLKSNLTLFKRIDKKNIEIYCKKIN